MKKYITKNIVYTEQYCAIMPGKYFLKSQNNNKLMYCVEKLLKRFSYLAKARNGSNKSTIYLHRLRRK